MTPTNEVFHWSIKISTHDHGFVFLYWRKRTKKVLKQIWVGIEKYYWLNIK